MNGISPSTDPAFLAGWYLDSIAGLSVPSIGCEKRSYTVQRSKAWLQQRRFTQDIAFAVQSLHLRYPAQVLRSFQVAYRQHVRSFLARANICLGSMFMAGARQYFFSQAGGAVATQAATFATVLQTRQLPAPDYAGMYVLPVQRYAADIRKSKPVSSQCWTLYLPAALKLP